jgi:hypothetical protein
VKSDLAGNSTLEFGIGTRGAASSEADRAFLRAGGRLNPLSTDRPSQFGLWT